MVCGETQRKQRYFQTIKSQQIRKLLLIYFLLLRFTDILGE